MKKSNLDVKNRSESKAWGFQQTRHTSQQTLSELTELS